MDSDIKLQNDTVEITGTKLKVDTSTTEIGCRTNDKFKGMILSDGGIGCYTYALSVRNPDVTPPDSQQRVALAQSSEDALMLNVNSHYTGGITVDGIVNVNDNLIIHKSLSIDTGGKLLFIKPGLIFKRPDGKVIHLPPQTTDLMETITQLTDRIKQLEDKVAALEAK